MYFYMFYLLNKQVVIYLDKKPIIRADRIKALLKENGLTMKFFNDKFGKNRSFLSNVLSGSDNIDAAQIEFLAEKPATTQDDELDKEFSELIKQLSPEQMEIIKAQIKGILSNY